MSNVSTQITFKLTPEQAAHLATLANTEARNEYLETIAEEGVAKASRRIAKKQATTYLINVGVLPPKGETHDQFLARLGLA